MYSCRLPEVCSTDFCDMGEVSDGQRRRNSSKTNSLAEIK